MGAATAFASPDSSVSSKRVVVIPVEEEVDYGLHAFLERATAEALEMEPDYILFKVNTWGGELNSAFEITDLILSIRECSTYVYVDQKAISAGALISLACNRMAMGEGTTIGDCAPIIQSSEGGVVVLGEKIQSPLRAKFRNLAERNGYPSLLSESMVTMDIGVVGAYPADTTAPPEYFAVAEWDNLPDARKAGFREHRIIVREGQLLTLTDREAEEHGFSQGSFVDFDAFLDHKGWEIVATISPNWSESMVRVLGKFTPILMLLGFGALYMELKSPGFGLFGTLGVLLLAVAFGAKYAVGLAAHTELLLLLGGFVLLALEIFVIPGTFIAGGIGVILVVAALTLSMQNFVVPDPELPWEFNALIDNLALTLGMAALALFIPLLAVRYALPRLPRRAAVVADATMREARSAAFDSPALGLGAVGETRTGLRPTGKAVFEGVTFEVTSQGGFVDPGKYVEVVRIHGRNVLVRPLENRA